MVTFEKRYEGTCKWYNQDKAFGFIFVYDLEKQLAVRLAIGEINQDTYNHALNMLKPVNTPDNNPLYG